MGQNNTETEVITMANISPYSFIVVLPQTIIEIPQSSNLSWLTLFYALPKELVENEQNIWNCHATSIRCCNPRNTQL